MRVFIELLEVRSDFENVLLDWTSQHDVACLLQSNRHRCGVNDPYSVFEMAVAVDAIDTFSASPTFDSLFAFQKQHKDWLFGFFTYDLKNEIEELSSSNADGHRFPPVHFFRPRYLFLKKVDRWELGYLEEYDSKESIKELLGRLASAEVPPEKSFQDLQIQQRVSRKEYLDNVNAIKQHIQRGDIYEMNYCVEFFSEGAGIESFIVYKHLNEISPMPFSCFYKTGDHYLACASPERFLAKRGAKIISQPIKGTIRRGKTAEEDELLKKQLSENEKERSENVMIVDLVRNDLSRTSARNSVKVEELFGIYSFRQLHQMISTVVSEMRDDVRWTDVIQNAFPMGSMTGAPKIRAMELIEEIETTKRGLYSGAVGYITPDCDFDFNVVIRSILYNSLSKYLSFMVGSAITINSDPEKEYDECLLKAKAMIQVLSGNKTERQFGGIAESV